MLWATHLRAWRKAWSFLFHSFLDPNLLHCLCIFLGPDPFLDLLFRPRLDVRLRFFILILKHSSVVIVSYSYPRPLLIFDSGHAFSWFRLAPWTSSLSWSAWLVPPTSPDSFSRGRLQSTTVQFLNYKLISPCCLAEVEAAFVLLLEAEGSESTTVSPF